MGNFSASLRKQIERVVKGGEGSGDFGHGGRPGKRGGSAKKITEETLKEKYDKEDARGITFDSLAEFINSHPDLSLRYSARVENWSGQVGGRTDPSHNRMVSGGKYITNGKQFVIVDKETRRVITKQNPQDWKPTYVAMNETYRLLSQLREKRDVAS